MTEQIKPYYDIVIMGGGPAGSTLGAQLARTTSLSVVIFDKEKFPRDHIGESLAHPTTPALEEIGALDKMLTDEFWVKKFGGIFDWDHQSPSVGFFDHESWQRDGAHRWAVHVNRSEFDHMLLRHARDCGVEVYEETSVTAYDPGSEGGVVTLKDGRKVGCGYFVDASGRRNSIAAKKKRNWLSGYKNIAIWQHYLGARHGYTLDYDWNIFRPGSLSPITCAAFKDGWCWYIPIRKVVDGKRTMTHSVGIVTIPAILKEPGKDFTDPEIFTRTIKEIPLIGELVQDAVPLQDKMLTATNYSMVNDEFVNFDERWILVGDAAYFVDPLFSSGVAFAMHHGLSAALLLKKTFDRDIPQEHKRDLWSDYDREWHGIAESFSLSIDQWYHAIGKNNPDSIYWKSRGETTDLAVREQTFHLLLNTVMEPDLLRVLTHEKGTQQDLDLDGPYMRAYRMADPGEPADDALLSTVDEVRVRSSLGLDIPGFKGFLPPAPFEAPPEMAEAVARYWDDPVKIGPELPSPLTEAMPCHRFALGTGDAEVEIRSFDEFDGGFSLWQRLRAEPMTYRRLKEIATEAQLGFFKTLLRTGMVRATDPAGSTAPAGPAVAGAAETRS